MTMPCYGYQYKKQCCIPGVVKHATPVFTQCQNPHVVKTVPCTPCTSNGSRTCTVRKTIQSGPTCCTPCSSRCVETHIVEGCCSSCSPSSPSPCTLAFPQPHVQGRNQLCVPHCGQTCVAVHPQVGTPAHVYQHSSYPYSYQWSKSYHYDCGQQ